MLSILGQVSYASKSLPLSLSIPHIAMLHLIITATEIEMQALTIVRAHCNEGIGTGVRFQSYIKHITR
jgi:hypothetical protein